MSAESSDPIKDIRDFVKKFNPVQMLNYLSVTAALPKNEIYCLRLETLFKIIISIRVKKFQNNELDDSSIDELLQKLETLQNWQMLEDFTPISLFDYPSIWILGKKYEIISGLQDRAYEYWKELVSDYFPIREKFSEYGYDPIVVIDEILTLQTKLIKFLKSQNVTYRKSGSLSVPSFELVQEWENIFIDWYDQTSCKIFLESHSVSFGRALPISKLVEQEPVDTLYKFYSLNVGDSTIPIFQHCVFGFLNSLFIKHFKELHEQNNDIHFDTKTRIYNKLIKLFNSQNIFPNFSIGNSKIIDFAIIFDTTKLFLIKVIDGDLSSNIQSEFDIAVEELKQINEKISRGEKRFEVNGNHVGTLRDVAIETIPIFLIKSAKLGGMIGLPKDPYLENKILWFGSFVDFLSMIDDLKTGMDFLKYLRRRQELHSRLESISFSSLDEYAHYTQNGNAFFVSGQPIHTVFFTPGLWDNYFAEKIRKRIDFQPRLDPNEPDDAWEVDVVTDKIFQVVQPLSKLTAGIFRLDDERVIWILTTGGDLGYTTEELRSFNLLTQLIPHRFTHTKAFENFLQKLNIGINDEIQFVLYPTSFISRQRFVGLYTMASMINSDLPIIVGSLVDIVTRKNHFSIVYSTEILSHMFDDDLLEGEKTIIRSILTTIASHFHPNEQENESFVEQCMKELFENAYANFNFMHLRHKLFLSNTQTDDYLKTLDSDIREVDRKTASFLQSESITHGTYQNEEAKNTLDNIITFLKTMLDEELSKFRTSEILPFSINLEGELIQNRQIWQMRTKNDLKQIQEFDPKEKYREKSLEISKISTTSRYISERIIQLCPTGDSFLTKEKWHEIQAIGESILYATIVRNTLYYEIGDFELQINDDFSFFIKNTNTESLETHSQNFDYELLKTGPAAIHWNDEEGSVDIFYDSLETPFESEYGVSFRNFMRVLSCCEYYPIEKQTHTLAIDENELISYVKSKWPEISDEHISNALKLSSLSQDDLSSVEIYPTDMRNRMNRLVVKPIPTYYINETKTYLLNSWVIDVSINRWLVSIDQGHLPYKEDYLSSNQLKDQLQTMRTNASKQHEIQIECIVKEKTNYFDVNIDNNEKCFSELLTPTPGEIDNLSIYPETHTVILIEAKNLQLNLGPQEIKGEINKYVKPEDGFFAKLNSKKQYVTDNLESILNYYNIEQNSETWKILGLIVTKTIPFSIPKIDDNEVIHVDNLEKIISDKLS